MTSRVDPGLLTELEAYGATGVGACFNCGNCTAACPLTTDGENFPRRLIRYAQLGLPERLAASKDLWLCYGCRQCSTTCPRQAEPGEFMAAARRFAIAQYDVTGLAGALYRSSWFSAIFTLALTLFFSLYLLAVSRPAPVERLALFEFVPEVFIQTIGLTVFGVAGVAAVAGSVRMTRAIARPASQDGVPSSGAQQRLNWLPALAETAAEVFGQKRYRHKDCEEQPSTPWYRRKWMVHAAIVYGFLGLFAATALDFLFKPAGSAVPLFYPMRLLGTIAGLLLMVGSSLAMADRWQKRGSKAGQSHHSDWTFLLLLWLTGLTGFMLEIAVYNLLPVPVGRVLLVAHVALAMDLLVLLPFSKFAHAYYRTIALFVRSLQQVAPVEANTEITIRSS
jgi:ferredoxin/nitrate reductase gamma subunit